MKRPTLLVLSSIALLLAAYNFVLAPLEEERPQLREELELRYETLQKYRKFMREKDTAAEDLRQASQKLRQLEKNVMRAKDPSLAFAKLQSRMQDLADRSGITIEAVKTRTPESRRGYVLLPLELDGRGDIKGLGNFLKALDAPGVFISIERLDISLGRALGRPAKGDLRIKIQVSGLMKT